MDKYGILAKQVATTAWADVYGCPVTSEQTYNAGAVSVKPWSADRATSTMISTIVLCRLAATGGAAEWISLGVVDGAGVAVNNSNYLFYQRNISGGTTVVVSLSMTLSAGQTIRAIAQANASVNVVINGVEIS